jgi:EGF-like domain
MRRLLGPLVFTIVAFACAPSYTTTDAPKTPVKPEACAPGTCTGSKTRCTAPNGTASCSCELGTHEEAGACVSDARCASDGATCSQHGTCSETKTGNVVCECDTPNGYTGARCNECLTTLGFHKAADGKKCTTDGCDILPKPCDAEADPNRKRCLVTAGKASCSCDEGYVLGNDMKCVIPQACDGQNTCSNRGTCSITSGKVSCACDAGYQGALCTQCASNYFPKGDGSCFSNPCDANPCAAQANTACVIDVSKPANYRCDCRFGDGFSQLGQYCFCSSDAFECTEDIIVGGKCVHPVRNGAACNDGDANACTAGVCNAAAQCTAVAVANNTGCTGADGCFGYACLMGACTAVSFVCGGGDGF